MPTLLHLDSSADLTQSYSRAITASFADAWRELGDDHAVIVRDLHRDPLPHLESAQLHWPERLRTDGPAPSREAELVQQEIIDELLSADVVVIGAPLYNYSMPSTLKAWIDRIHVPGVTAPFDVDTQPLAGRPVVIVSSRGGSYEAGTAKADWDHEIPALQIILGDALGMDVHVITTSHTLAATVPALSDRLELSLEQFAAARSAAEELARTLG